MNALMLYQLSVLTAGTIFAWGNFTREFIAWRKKTVCTDGCAPGANPFLTPCFYGAIFFTIALILHYLIMQK